MPGSVFFNNGVTVGGGGSKLLNGLLTAITSEMDVQTDYAEKKDTLMFYEQQALSLEETFSGIA